MTFALDVLLPLGINLLYGFQDGIVNPRGDAAFAPIEGQQGKQVLDIGVVPNALLDQRKNERGLANIGDLRFTHQDCGSISGPDASRTFVREYPKSAH